MAESLNELMKSHKFKSSSSNTKLRKIIKNSALNGYRNIGVSRNNNRYTAKSLSTLPNLPKKSTVSQDINKSINKKFSKQHLKEKLHDITRNCGVNAFKLDHLIKKHNPNEFTYNTGKYQTVNLDESD
mmetsp:Transcript_8483/g.7505  ORF Transcript_8483/g.7505 Transcript_8483/m.7505 type:complete len:128 (+) Transcript_8483:120-503(+)